MKKMTNFVKEHLHPSPPHMMKIKVLAQIANPLPHSENESDLIWPHQRLLNTISAPALPMIAHKDSPQKTIGKALRPQTAPEYVYWSQSILFLSFRLTTRFKNFPYELIADQQRRKEHMLMPTTTRVLACHPCNESRSKNMSISPTVKREHPISLVFE